MATTLKTLRKKNPKVAQRTKRAAGIRKRLDGTAARPRLSVYRTAKHIYVQAIDDATGVTVATASTVDKALKGALGGLKKADQAKKVGELLGKRLKDKGIAAGIFDRNGFRYHGRIAAVADGAREAGLQF
jgi:large subunit ribosomal protein L18